MTCLIKLYTNKNKCMIKNISSSMKNRISQNKNNATINSLEFILKNKLLLF